MTQDTAPKKKQISQRAQLSLKTLINKQLKPVYAWFEERALREKYLILGAILVACLIGLERCYSMTAELFDTQSTRLTELEDTLGKITVLLHNYNRFERQRKMAEQRFSEAGSSSAHYAHIEGVISRKARIGEGKFRINKGAGETTIGDKFLRVPFAVTFTRVELGELSSFLKEISSDRERPAILSKLTVSTRGSFLQAEVTLDLVARRS